MVIFIYFYSVKKKSQLILDHSKKPLKVALLFFVMGKEPKMSNLTLSRIKIKKMLMYMDKV